MQEPFSRDRIIDVLKAMPADATVDDAIEKLVFLAKIESGLAELDRSEGLPHDEPLWTLMQIVWSPQSLRDLRAIRDYIAKDSEQYANLTIARLFSRCGATSSFSTVRTHRSGDGL